MAIGRAMPAVAALVLAAGTVGWAGGATAYEPVFEPAACWFTLPDGQTADCGYLVVPENRAMADSPDIRIAVAILRHPDGAPEPDPILRLHGGPAGGYLSFMEVAWSDDATLFAANRDVIAFDQRGQGKSEPRLDCPEAVATLFGVQDYELAGETLTARTYHARIGAAFGRCHDRLAATHDLSAYDSAANAADAADLMRALGYDRYNIHAGSYGTIVAQYMMRDHPDGIRAVILDAPGLVDETVEGTVGGFSHAFDTVLDACAANASCVAAFPDLRAQWRATLARLDADPPVVDAVDDFGGRPFKVRVDAAAAIVPLRLALTNPGQMRTVPLYMARVADGDYGLVAKGWGGFMARAGTFLGWGSFLSIHCGGMVSISDPAALDRAIAGRPDLAAYYDHGPLDGRLAFELCANWPVAPASADEVAPVTSAIPTLVMYGEIDAATNPDDAAEAVARLGHAYGPYVFPALGHIVGLGDHACPVAVETAFLNEPSSEPDTGCIAAMAPVSFLTELGGGDFALVDYAGRGYRGVAPDSWNELKPGVFARSDPAVDKTLFLQLAAPAAEAPGMIADVLADFGLSALPETPLRRLPGEALTWEVYLPAGAVPMIVARAENAEAVFLTALIAPRGELDGLAETLLIPALTALRPAE